MRSFLLSVLLLPLFLLGASTAQADCLPGAPNCDLPATNESECTAAGGSWFNGSCRGATGIPPGTSPAPTSPAGGGINSSYLQQYRDVIIWAVNNVLLPIVISIAFIVFIWGVYKYFIKGADSEDDRKSGRQFVLWGIIGFVIIFSVWGLVNLVGATLGLRPGGGSPPIPTIGGSSAPGSYVPGSGGGGATNPFGGSRTTGGGTRTTGGGGSGGGGTSYTRTDTVCNGAASNCQAQCAGTWNADTYTCTTYTANTTNYREYESDGRVCTEDAAGNVSCTAGETGLYDPPVSPEAEGSGGGEATSYPYEDNTPADGEPI